MFLSTTDFSVFPVSRELKEVCGSFFTGAFSRLTSTRLGRHRYLGTL